jgi:hypothetical protein
MVMREYGVGEGDGRDGMGDAPAAEVIAVLAVHGYVLCAGELGVEDVSSAGEEEEHGCGLCACGTRTDFEGMCICRPESCSCAEVSW